MNNFLIKNKASIWLTFLVLIISAIMMQPGIAALIALSIEAAVLFLMRYVAHLEGANKR